MDSLFPQNMCKTCATSTNNYMRIENTTLDYEGKTIPILDILSLLSDIKVKNQ